jgi:hypothetical protein
MTTIPTATKARELSYHTELPEKVIIGVKDAISNHAYGVRIYSPGVSQGNIVFLQNRGYVCNYNLGNNTPRIPRESYPEDYNYLDISWNE